MRALTGRGLGVALGLLADRALGEPPNSVHPVAGFGAAMGAVESAVWADSRRAGVAYTALGTGLGLGVGAALRGGRVLSTATAVEVAAAGRMLRDTASAIGTDLVDGDLDAARAALPALCGRDAEGLDRSGLAAAVVESVAENLVDAVVAPAWWGLVAGAPGALAHRAVNTMDAMVGHRNERYQRFGWSSARLDDGAAYLPARLTAALVAGVRPRAARAVLRGVRRDAPAHPSPNAGVAEAAFAAALGLELGGPLRYAGRFDERPRLGAGPRPQPVDVARAVRLADDVERALVGGLVAVATGATLWSGVRR